MTLLKPAGGSPFCSTMCTRRCCRVDYLVFHAGPHGVHAMATPSSSSSWLLEGLPPGRWPVELKRKNNQKARDWAELPRDALLLVLEKLHHVDVLRGPELVCRNWHRAARDEPALWRRIDFRHRRVDDSSRWSLRLMAYAAVRRSQGRCDAFWGEGTVDERVMSLLQDSALSLKSLRIISCERINDRRLSADISNFLMLQELEISNCCPENFSRTCMVVGNSCPRLTRFRLSSPSFFAWNRHFTNSEVDGEVEGITRMCGLRVLQLFAQTISTGGLAYILDSCVQLESLDIRHCFNIKMDDDMMARCSRLETLRLPFDPTGDYDLEFSAHEMRRAMYLWPPR